jgi:hypothetical protein
MKKKFSFRKFFFFQPQEKLDLLKKACDAHVKYMREATEAQV